MTKAKKAWGIRYHILGEALPTQFTAMKVSMSHEDVRWTKVNLRGVVIEFITHRVHYEHGDSDDLEDLCARLNRCMLKSCGAVTMDPATRGVAPAPGWGQGVSSGVAPAAGRLPTYHSRSDQASFHCPLDNDAHYGGQSPYTQPGVG